MEDYHLHSLVDDLDVSLANAQSGPVVPCRGQADRRVVELPGQETRQRQRRPVHQGAAATARNGAHPYANPDRAQRSRRHCRGRGQAPSPGPRPGRHPQPATPASPGQYRKRSEYLQRTGIPQLPSYRGNPKPSLGPAQGATPAGWPPGGFGPTGTLRSPLSPGIQPDKGVAHRARPSGGSSPPFGPKKIRGASGGTRRKAVVASCSAPGRRLLPAV